MTTPLELRRLLIRSAGLQDTRRSPKPIPFMASVRTLYVAELRHMLEESKADVEQFMENLPETRIDQEEFGEQESNALQDSAVIASIALLITSLKRRLTSVFSQAAARRLAARVVATGARRFASRFRDQMESIGVIVGDGQISESVVAAAVRENVSLIVDIGESTAKKIEQAVMRAVGSGKTKIELAKEIGEIMRVSDRRAVLIANDQIEKLQGRLNRAAQTAVGLKKYRWITVGDDRVRPAHRARHGKVFDWSKPPPDGHPGEPVNCRCSAVPVWEGVQ